MGKGNDEESQGQKPQGHVSDVIHVVGRKGEGEEGVEDAVPKGLAPEIMADQEEKAGAEGGSDEQGFEGEGETFAFLGLFHWGLLSNKHRDYEVKVTKE